MIFLILHLTGIVPFGWLWMFIETIIEIFVFGFSVSDTNDIPTVPAVILLSVSCFSAYKAFLHLSVSNWFILLTPIFITLVLIIPFGFTIANFIMAHFGLIVFPVWSIIASIVVDILIIILFCNYSYSSESEINSYFPISSKYSSKHIPFSIM